MWHVADIVILKCRDTIVILKCLIVFRAADFDPEDTVAFLIATSGTTGLPKAAAVTHKNLASSTPYVW